MTSHLTSYECMMDNIALFYVFLMLRAYCKIVLQPLEKAVEPDFLASFQPSACLARRMLTEISVMRTSSEASCK